jgi:HAD superfamily hydrolase (TIGR01509 family)
MSPTLRGVVFDFGNVIAAPKSGIWTIPTDFNVLFEAEGMPMPTEAEIRRAQERACQLLDKDHTQQTIEAEAKAFGAYYEELLSCLGITRGVPKLAADLAHEDVYSDKHIFYYPDVARVARELFSRGIVLGVLSDNWPSLFQRLERLQILNCFKTVVISSIEKRCKPDALVFNAATTRMDLPTKSMLFVDDDLENVEAAHQLGFNVLLMDRRDSTVNAAHRVVRTFDDVRAEFD